MTVQQEFRPPEERFGTATLFPLLVKAARTDTGIDFIDGAGGVRRLDFRELYSRAVEAAAVLRSHGVRFGDRVCLLSSTSPELVAALWGVWGASAVPVVLSLPRRQDAAVYAEELSRRVEQARARLLVVADDFAPLLAGQPVGAEVVTVGQLHATELVGEDTPVSAPDDLALMQFTSGTTARSRAVALTHRQLLSNISAFSDALGLRPEDRATSWLPLYHDMGIVTVIGAVAHAMPLVLQPPEDFLSRPGSWMDAISRYHSTVTVAPNMGYALAARDLRRRPRELDLSGLRMAGNGAEPIEARVLAEFAEQAGRYGFQAGALCPMYGLAEVTLAATTSRPGDVPREVWVSREALEAEKVVRPTPPKKAGARRLVACGSPIPGTRVEIRDADGGVLPDDRVGEIWVRSPSAMHGYWRDKESSRAILRDGWLVTGDLGFLYEGELVICGRTKDMIVVGGRNLYPEDYEQLAATKEGIRRGNVIAFGLVDQERMVVVAETSLPADPAGRVAAEVMKLLTRELSQAPERVILVPPGTLPKTSSGKIQRGVFRERYVSGTFQAVASATRT